MKRWLFGPLAAIALWLSATQPGNAPESMRLGTEKFTGATSQLTYQGDAQVQNVWWRGRYYRWRPYRYYNYGYYYPYYRSYYYPYYRSYYYPPYGYYAPYRSYYY